jgi:hypothetical protein
MLEILAIYFLGKKVGESAARKGYSQGLFTALFVGLWFLGEIFGFIVGFALMRGRQGIGVPYGIALVMAVLGAFTAFIVVMLLPESGRRRRRRRRVRRVRRPVRDDYDYDDDDDSGPPRRRRPVEHELEDHYEERPSRPRARQRDYDECPSDPPRRRSRRADRDEDDE